jgi:3'-phosphoadenosine 5'-phosphosulfate sulfotransferase (PAPS reductase)/FAD synthetase
MNVSKVDSALQLIRDAKNKFGSGLFLGHSGGKDSTVVLHLTSQVIKPHELTIVHNVKPLLNETEDDVAKLTAMHELTLQFLYKMVGTKYEVQFMHSSKMPNWIAKNMLKCQIDGARRSEWNRPGKSSEIIVNGEKISRKDMPSFVERGIFDLSMLYPIYDWTDDDVFDYLHENEIPMSQEYFVNGEVVDYLQRKKSYDEKCSDTVAAY